MPIASPEQYAARLDEEPSTTEAAEVLAIGERALWRTDFDRHLVPLSDFQSGGPGRDGIPPLDAPKIVDLLGGDAYLKPQEPVLAIEVHGQTRAYPLQIMVWHEIANDTVGGVPVAVT